MSQYIYNPISNEYFHNHCINCYRDMSNSAASLCHDCEDEMLELFTDLAEEVRN